MAKQKRGLKTRRRILTVAANEFARRGYDATSLEVIATAVEIRPASLFYHFPDGKQQIRRAIFHTIAESFSELWSSVLDMDEKPVAMLLALTEEFWNYCSDHAAFVTFLLREMMDPQSEWGKTIVEINRPLVKGATEYILKAQKEGILAEFNPQSFMYSAATYTLLFFAAPWFPRNFWPGLPNKATQESARKELLSHVADRITP